MKSRFGWLLVGLLLPLGVTPALDAATVQRPSPPARIVSPKPGREAVASAHRLATEAMYRNADGTLNSRASLEGPTSAGIPGAPAGLVWVNRKYGKLKLAEDLAPVIRIAREGFQPDARFLKPRYHMQYLPDLVFVEPGTFDPQVADQLEKMGYTLKLRQPWGFMNAVIWNRKDNRLDAASDPRGTSGLGKVQ